MSKEFSKDEQIMSKNHRQYFDLQPQQQANEQQEVSFLQLPFAIQQSQYYKKLIESKRFYRKSEWATLIKQNCINTDFQSISIQLHYGPFATKINVIYLEVVYKEESNSFVNSGSFGRIQTCVYNDQTVAVKLIKLNHNKQFSEIERVYQQYFIALMASELKVGPQLINVFGYQIVFLKNYALFGMELCENFNSQKLSNRKKISNVEQSLKNALDILHSLHVVHRDIKPENIMWSPSFQKLVFIDFGLSEIVKERQGEKTLTSYVGSYSYCSPEMQKCFVLQKSRHVDLYQNDVFGLEKSYKNIFLVSIKTQLFNKTQTKNEFVDCLVEIVNLKMQNFLRNFDNAYECLIRCKIALKTCLYISNKIKQNQIFCEQKFKKWEEWQNLTKQKLIKSKLVTSNSQQIFLKAIQGNNKNSFSYLLPFYSVLETQLRNLSKWISNEMWLSRIYFILYPSPKRQGQFQLCPQIILLIIDKMYSFLQKIPTQIFIKKIRRVLLFFFEKFSQLKNKQLLQSLSDFFIIIGDIFSSIKIRNFILTITQDPLQYCLKNIMYYILNFQFGLSCEGFSIESLENMKKVVNPQISKLYPQILQIVNTLSLNIIFEIPILEELFQLFETLRSKIQKINPEFCQIIYRTLRRFKMICLIPLNRKTYDWQKNWLSKLYQIIDFGIKVNNSASRVKPQPIYNCVSMEFNYYIYSKRFIDEGRIMNGQNEKLIKEYVQFYFLLTKNKQRLSIRSFALILQKKFKEDSSIIMLVLKERIKCTQNFQTLNVPGLVYDIIFIIQNFYINIQALCEKIDKNNNQQREEAQKLIHQSLQCLRSRVKLSIKDERDIFYLSVYIKILTLFRIDYQACQQEILQKGAQLCQQIKGFQKPEYLRGKLLTILVNILRKKYFNKQQSIRKLQELLYQVFQISPHFDSFLICYKEILQISRKYKYQFAAIYGYQFMIYLSNYINCMDNTLPHSYTYPYNKAVSSFVQQYTSQQVTKILMVLDSGENSLPFSYAKEHIHGCYLIFKMLQKCNKQSKLVRINLFKIATCLSKFYNTTKLEILETYFSFFTKINKQKERKLLICQRLQARYNFLESNMRQTKRKVEKKSKKYPQIIRFKLMQKLDQIFG